MKKTISLSVEKPCAENWNHFTPTERGGFCKHCSKNVIDFTKMSDKEMLAFFSSKSAHTCGRFRPDQLKAYATETAPPKSAGLSWMQTGFLSLLLLLGSKQSVAKSASPAGATEVVHHQDRQEEKGKKTLVAHVIKGRVIDEFNEPLPGVSIYLKGASVGTTTDLDGKFTFPQELEAGDVLVFSFIGYETREYVVPKNAPAVLEIPLIFFEAALIGEVSVNELYTGKKPALNSLWQKVKGLF